VTLLWSAKESALKALGVGLRADTRSVSLAEPPESGCLRNADPIWRRLSMRCAFGELPGWWQSSDDFVRTVVGAFTRERRL